MDDDQLDLIRALSTQAGMIFEDASLKALVVGGMSAAQLRTMIKDVRSMTSRATAVLAAAGALLNDMTAATPDDADL